MHARLLEGGPLDGSSPDPTILQAYFEDAWDREASGAAFGADEDVGLLKRQAAMLTRKYLDEVAPKIEPAALELPVQGVIGRVPVRGFVDLLDTSGRVIDLKTAVRKLTGVNERLRIPGSYVRAALPGDQRKARVDTLVATNTPQVVTQGYTVSPADLRMTEKLCPLVQEAMLGESICQTAEVPIAAGSFAISLGPASLISADACGERRRTWHRPV